jgi:pimeloyl-ACP methyl ester carboxylesterase
MNQTASWKSLYPFESHELQLDGLRYHYIDEGSGSPLLMVHGNPTWSFYWRNIAQAFQDTHRVIVPDHIGCGLSDKPQKYNYTLEQHIQNLSQLVEHLDLRNVTLLVHDWGGAIGLGTALRLSDRFSRFVVFNTGAFPPPYVPFRIRVCRTPLLGTIAMRGFNLFARAALSMATEKPERLNSAVKAGLLAPYDNWTNRVAIDNFVRDIPLSPAHPTWDTLTDIENGLPTLADRPIKLIWGMKDWCFSPVCLEKFAGIWPDAEVHRIDDAGHYVIEDATEEVIGIVETFLADSRG